MWLPILVSSMIMTAELNTSSRWGDPEMVACDVMLSGLYYYVIFLQGHGNSITCCSVSRDKRGIVTADTGEDSVVVASDSLDR